MKDIIELKSYHYSNVEHINRDINEFGYAIVDFLSKEEVEFLLEQYFSLKNDLGKGFHATMHSKDIEYRRKVNEIIGAVFNSKAQIYVPGYRQLNSNFTVKESGVESFFDFHLDWNMVDESVYRSITIWCPLVDTNPNNGNLWVLEKSHLLGSSFRCGPGLYLYFTNPEELNYRRFKKKELQLKAGQAIIYDHKLFHGSPPNLTNITRVAINQSMVPLEATSRHYVLSESKIIGYDVNDDFYCRVMIDGINDYGEKREEVIISHSFMQQNSINKLIR